MPDLTDDKAFNTPLQPDEVYKQIGPDAWKDFQDEKAYLEN